MRTFPPDDSDEDLGALTEEGVFPGEPAHRVLSIEEIGLAFDNALDSTPETALPPTVGILISPPDAAEVLGLLV